MCFSKLVIIYMLGGLVGTLWETGLNLVKGRGFVYCNGSLLTPFNFVYGTGAVVIILCLGHCQKWWQVYLLGTICGGVVEYMLSFLEELILGTRSWNYENRLLNINGRTTVPYMLFWGFLCTLVIFCVWRPLEPILDGIPAPILHWIAGIAAAVIALDFVVTVSALFRYTGRYAGKEAATAIGRMADRFFGDAFMHKRFPKMKF